MVILVDQNNGDRIQTIADRYVLVFSSVGLEKKDQVVIVEPNDHNNLIYGS